MDNYWGLMLVDKNSSRMLLKWVKIEKKTRFLVTHVTLFWVICGKNVLKNLKIFYSIEKNRKTYRSDLIRNFPRCIAKVTNLIKSMVKVNIVQKIIHNINFINRMISLISWVDILRMYIKNNFLITKRFIFL